MLFYVDALNVGHRIALIKVLNCEACEVESKMS